MEAAMKCKGNASASLHTVALRARPLIALETVMAMDFVTNSLAAVLAKKGMLAMAA
jgi:hypothetical protein